MTCDCRSRHDLSLYLFPSSLLFIAIFLSQFVLPCLFLFLFLVNTIFSSLFLQSSRLFRFLLITMLPCLFLSFPHLFIFYLWFSVSLSRSQSSSLNLFTSLFLSQPECLLLSSFSISPCLAPSSPVRKLSSARWTSVWKFSTIQPTGVLCLCPPAAFPLFLGSRGSSR